MIALVLAAWIVAAPKAYLVWGVHDGDTITATDPGGAVVTVRLNGIDAPELAQPGGREARDWLKSKLVGRRVELLERGRDRYGRLLADVRLAGRPAGIAETLNWQLVDEGHAWQFRRYDRTDALERAELNAREAGKGVWVVQNPESPWAFRERRRR